jgi:organic radical activating enzyme
LNIIFSGSFHNYVYDDTLFVSWNLIEDCNFNCYYCGTKQGRSYGKDNYKKLLNEELISNVIDLISSKTNYEKIDFTISGGEPSIIEEHLFEFLLNEIKDKLSSFKTTIRYMTNLSNEISYYKKLWNILDNSRILFSPTIHYQSNIDKFESKIKKLSYEPIIIDIRVPIIAKSIRMSIHRYEKLKKMISENIFVIPKYIMEFENKINKNTYDWIVRENEDIVYKQPLDLSFDTLILDDNDNVIWKKQNRDIFSNYYKKGIKWICYLKSNIFIDYKGLSWKCINDSNAGNIIDNDIVVCEYPVCSCGHQIPKINLKYKKRVEKIKESFNES